MLHTRSAALLGLVVVLFMSSCSKEEPIAPGTGVPGFLKDGDTDVVGDQGRVSGPAAGSLEMLKEPMHAPPGYLREFEGEGDDDGISDDGDDEGDKEKSNKKPRTN